MLDWLHASNADRKVLYQVIKGLIDAEGMSWDALYKQALGRDFARGKGFEKNFSDGRIARGLAQDIFRWLERSHPDQAARVNDLLARITDSAASPTWSAMVDRHARFGLIECLPGRRQSMRPMGVDLKRWVVEDDEFEVGLGEAFRLCVELPCSGELHGFQERRGRWRSMPVAEANPMFIQATGDPLLLPESDDLAENYDLGPQRLVLLVTPKGALDAFGSALDDSDFLPMPMLDRLAAHVVALEPRTWCLLGVDIKVIVRHMDGSHVSPSPEI